MIMKRAIMPGVDSQHEHSPFRFAISGDLDDFAAFCAIIRGQMSVDEATIKKLTRHLKTSTDALTAAEQAAAVPPQPK